MSKRSGLGQGLYVGGYDLSGDISSLQNVKGGAGLLNMTGIDKSAYERVGGQFDAGMDLTTFFNDAAGRLHAVISLLPRTDVIVTYLTATTAGAPAACLVAKQANYDPQRANDGMLTNGVNLMANGQYLEWCEALTAGQQTDTTGTNGTALDGGAQGSALTISANSIANPTVITTSAPHGLITGDSVTVAGSNSTPSIDGNYTVTKIGASTFTIPVNVTGAGSAGTVTKTSTNFGLASYLHVFSLTGTNVIVTLQDSADGTTWANLTGGAHTSVTSAPGAERIVTTSALTVRRYLRAVSSGTFAGAVYSIAIARALTTTW